MVVTDRPVGYHLPMSAPRTRRKDARPGEILAAALSLFAERGYAATRLDDVAHRAGIAKGTIYLYFPTKEDLFRAVVRQDLLPNLAALEALAAAHRGSAAALLRQLVTAMAARMDTEIAAIPRLVLSESGNLPTLARFYAEEVVARGLALIGGVIARGVAAGEFRDVPPAVVAPLVVAPLLMAMLWRGSIGRHAPPAVDPAALLETHMDLLLRGLAP